jgi:hypothetical protein
LLLSLQQRQESDLELLTQEAEQLKASYRNTTLLPGPHNLKERLAYSEVRKCACLYKSSRLALFCSNVPAEWLFSRCALQIICRMLRIVEVCLLPLLDMKKETVCHAGLAGEREVTASGVE